MNSVGVTDSTCGEKRLHISDQPKFQMGQMLSWRNEKYQKHYMKLLANRKSQGRECFPKPNTKAISHNRKCELIWLHKNLKLICIKKDNCSWLQTSFKNI